MSQSIEEVASIQRQVASMQALLRLPIHEALGVACGILLQASFEHPVELRRVLNEQVVREGFRGESLATTIARVAR